MTTRTNVSLPAISLSGITGRTPFQLSQLEDIQGRPDFVSFVTFDGDLVKTFSTEKSPSPMQILWYDRMQSLHTVRVGVSKILGEIVVPRPR